MTYLEIFQSNIVKYTTNRYVDCNAASWFSILYVVFYRSVCGLIFRQTDYFGIMVLFLRHKNIYLVQRNLVPLPHLLI